MQGWQYINDVGRKVNRHNVLRIDVCLLILREDMKEGREVAKCACTSSHSAVYCDDDNDVLLYILPLQLQ